MSLGGVVPPVWSLHCAFSSTGVKLKSMQSFISLPHFSSTEKLFDQSHGSWENRYEITVMLFWLQRWEVKSFCRIGVSQWASGEQTWAEGLIHPTAVCSLVPSRWSAFPVRVFKCSPGDKEGHLNKSWALPVCLKVFVCSHTYSLWRESYMLRCIKKKSKTKWMDAETFICRALFTGM